MINYEIKSQLAKLLATENMVVENRNVQTAQFDVEKRILTLPMWKRASNVVYDMLVGHEVGHALFTPNEWGWEDRIPKQFVNVTEDARIEKLMKRRYPGLSKSFYKGYQELAENDFFEIEGRDLSDMNLADRANLYFKIGNFIKVPIASGKEQEIIDMMSETETFADAVTVAEILFKYCKEQIEEESVDFPVSSNNEGETSGESSSSNKESDERTEDNSEQESSNVEGGSSEDIKSQSKESKLEVETDDTFESGSQEFNGNVENTRNVNYIQIPKVNLEEIVIGNKRVHEELENKWIDVSTPRKYWDAYNQMHKETKPVTFDIPDTEYTSFKKTAQREVNYLVKEFESKKSADSYSRSFVSKTGTLDCTKLHTYKYNEDLFKKVNIIPDGKNHGLIFILDWSGSMGNCLMDTIKQLYNLVWFCDKVNIPFDVYAFTNNYYDEIKQFHKFDETTIQEVIEYEFIVSQDFKLLHFLTSGVNRKELDRQLKSFFRLCVAQCRWVDYTIPNGYGLSGTPLNESLICLHQIIPQFKQKYKVQKVNTVILTDGEANVLSYFKENNYFDDTRMGMGRMYAGDYVRNRKTGHTYKVEHEYHKFSEILLKDLKQVFPDVNFIGIRIADSGEFKGFVRKYIPDLTEEQYKKIRKDKFVSIMNSGYTSYFGMFSKFLQNDTELDVEEGASKSKIRSAFTKTLSNKSLNRKVLSQFIDIVS